MVSTAIGEDKGRFQVALLTLGATHARFGHTQEALSALNESVRYTNQVIVYGVCSKALPTRAQGTRRRRSPRSTSRWSPAPRISVTSPYKHHCALNPFGDSLENTSNCL